MTDPATVEAVTKAFPQARTSEFRGDMRVVLPADVLYSALEFLKQQRKFDYLVDITCVDYLNYRDAVDRFGLVYLLAGDRNERAVDDLRVFLNEPDLTVPSAVPLWEGANWMEREVFDMFGIQFRRSSRSAPHLAARGIHGLPAPQGLSAAGPRRAAQLSRAHAPRRLNGSRPRIAFVHFNRGGTCRKLMAIATSTAEFDREQAENYVWTLNFGPQHPATHTTCGSC